MNPFDDFIGERVRVQSSDKFWSSLSFDSVLKATHFHRPDPRTHIVAFHFENGVRLEALVTQVIESRPGEPPSLMFRIGDNYIYIKKREGAAHE